LLNRLILEAFSKLSAAQVIERLDQAGIANARMNDIQGVWDHAQLAARQRWTKVQTPAGEIPALYPPGIAPGDEPNMGPVPALGQHTDAILSELGLSKARIAEMREAGTV
jgi:crotonobetainyl-CoA:carnitine CoA-transferase CaiB-like acyl-CoA transferase